MANPRATRAGVVTLTTDFGTSDPYVAQMKGVILGIAPDANVLDLSHSLAPQDVRAAALFLEAAVPRFPEGTVHVCVVDPGVGTERRPIAVATRGSFLVGPDNGCFTPFLDDPEMRCVHLDRPERWLQAVSATFHGRDVFAPVGAHLARGLALADVGSAVDDPVTLPFPQPRIEDDGVGGERVLGEVLHVDHFGNLITNVAFERRGSGAAGGPRYRVRIAGAELAGPVRAYGDTEPGDLLTLVGSSGRVEVSVNRGRADERLGATVGTPVDLVWDHEEDGGRSGA